MVSFAAVGYGGNVYVGSQFFPNLKGKRFPSKSVSAIDSHSAAQFLPPINVFAIDSAGTMIWSYRADYPVSSSPSLGLGGQVYFGTGPIADTLYALTSMGALSWSYAIGLMGLSSPAIGSDGAICAGAFDGNIYAFNDDSSIIWSYQTGSYIESSPAVGSNGTVLIGAADGNVYALNSTGSLAWSYLTGDFVGSSPAVGSSGAVFIGSGGINVFAFASTGANAHVPTSNDTNVYALSSTGSLAWSYATGNIVESSPSIGSSGALYIGSFDNNLYCFQDPPTPTPVPTPTPSRVLVILNTDIATAGTLVIADGVIPPIPPANSADCYSPVKTPPQASAPPGNPVDCYILVQTPSDQIYSVMPGGMVVVKGIVPAVRGIRLPDGWSGNLFRKKICRGARGVYTVGLIVMPSGIPINLDRAIGYDLKDLTVVQ